MASYYKGLEFRTFLEAHWAAFFDLAGWKWSFNPKEIDEWRPDFLVTIPCGHSECGGDHTLVVSILAVDSLSQVQGHPSLKYSYEVTDADGKWIADAGALFGKSPSISEWQMSHGAGGGIENVLGWVSNANELLEKAEIMLG